MTYLLQHIDVRILVLQEQRAQSKSREQEHTAHVNYFCWDARKTRVMLCIFNIH